MLTLRPSTADDLVRVLAIESAPDTAKWLGQTGWPWHDQARSDPDQEHLVAVVGETIVGFCVAAGLRSADRDIELRRMAIAPERRGDGLGRLLLRSMIAARTNRVPVVSGWTSNRTTHELERSIDPRGLSRRIRPLRAGI